ncbi:hypothetical protein ACLOJK_006147 [Asimina triloba]
MTRGQKLVRTNRVLVQREAPGGVETHDPPFRETSCNFFELESKDPYGGDASITQEKRRTIAVMGKTLIEISLTKDRVELEPAIHPFEAREANPDFGEGELPCQ